MFSCEIFLSCLYIFLIFNNICFTIYSYYFLFNIYWLSYFLILSNFYHKIMITFRTHFHGAYYIIVSVVIVFYFICIIIIIFIFWIGNNCLQLLKLKTELHYQLFVSYEQKDTYKWYRYKVGFLFLWFLFLYNCLSYIIFVSYIEFII